MKIPPFGHVYRVAFCSSEVSPSNMATGPGRGRDGPRPYLTDHTASLPYVSLRELKAGEGFKAHVFVSLYVFSVTYCCKLAIFCKGLIEIGYYWMSGGGISDAFG